MKKIGRVTYDTAVPPPGGADMLRFVDVDQNVCIGCKNCEYVCPTGAIVGVDPGDRWSKHHIPNPAKCIYCGQCLVNCPVTAIFERVSFIGEVKKALADPGMLTVAMPAPAIRYALGEEFGLPDGSVVEGKMFAALKELGFDVLWDVQFGADVTIMEEGAELKRRLTGEFDRTLPQFTSCCPGWIRFVETYYTDLIPHLSSTKTPTQINGMLAKTYGAENIGADPSRMFTVAVMPCVSKKYEGLRAENEVNGLRAIDATIDTRELASMIRDAGIDFKSLPDNVTPHPLMGVSSGGGTIFGVTGGVMEAMLRYAAELLSPEDRERITFSEVRGTGGVREATVDIAGTKLNVAVVNGLKNAWDICERMRKGDTPYQAIEVMACPGGCVNGGGQPYVDWTRRPGFSALWDMHRILTDRIGPGGMEERRS